MEKEKTSPDREAIFQEKHKSTRTECEMFYPRNVADGYRLEYWKVSAPSFEPQRFVAVYHVKATYQQATGDDDPNAKDLVAEWMIFQDGESLGRADGWNYFRTLERKRLFPGNLPQTYTDLGRATEVSRKQLEKMIAISLIRIESIQGRIQKYEKTLRSLREDSS